MAAYMKLGDIKGEASDAKHKDWIELTGITSVLARSIPDGARDAQRSRGETTLGDIVVVKELDKSSVKLQEASATGVFYADAEIHFVRSGAVGSGTARGEPYLTYKLENVVITSYLAALDSPDSVPSEQISLGYTAADWTYTVLDARGATMGHVTGQYQP